MVSPAELERTCQKIVETPGKTPFERKQLEQVAKQLKSPISGNIQFIFMQGTMNVEEVAGDQTKFQKQLNENDRDGFTIVSCVEYPASRGTVHITSSDPAKNPAVDPAFLGHSADVDVLATALGFSDKIAQSPALKGNIHRRAYPPESIDVHDHASASEAVRDFCLTEYHPCGTCAIGQVVDARLKVYGVQGLRVVDASVFPGNVSGNILSTVYAVAERAVDLIKEDADRLRSEL
jgi:choline dehydrogenase-like flavoprotein